MGLFPYVGGDTNIAKFIVSLLPRGEVFLEPFGGAGSVSMEVVRRNIYKKVILNDADKHIYAIYYVLKNHPELFPTVCDMIMFCNNREEEEKKGIKVFYKQLINEIKNDMINDIIELGVLGIIIYTGINCPFYENMGLMLRMEHNKYLHEKDLCMKYLFERWEILQGIDIMNADTIKLVNEYDKEGVVMYLDPPHLGLEYYRLNYKKDDAIRLAEALSKIKHAKILLKISVNDLQVYKNILKSWNVIEKEYVVQTTRPRNRNKKKTKYYFMMNYKRSSLLDWL